MANWLLHKSFTFTDSLTGKTVAQLCDQYEADTGGEWSENVGVQAARSWAVDCLKRATNIDDKSTIVAAIKTTKLETIYGPIDFTEPVSATGRHPFPKCLQGCDQRHQQCVKGADAQPTPDTKFTYDSNVVGADFLEGLPTYQTHRGGVFVERRGCQSCVFCSSANRYRPLLRLQRGGGRTIVRQGYRRGIR